MKKGGRNFSRKALSQISLCQYLLSENYYVSQQEIRRSMQQHGFTEISQATISRLLNIIGVVKVANARGLKVYSIAQPQYAIPAFRSLADMIVSIEHNKQFILVHTLSACASYVAHAMERQRFSEILGLVVSSNTLWITPVEIRQISSLYQKIDSFLKTQKHSL